MIKYKYINGYNLEKTMAMIRKGNNGTKAFDSSVEYEPCQYLTDDGNKCVIGCFIPDDPVIQGYPGTVGPLISRWPDLISFMPIEEKGLDDFQAVHDGYSSRSGASLHTTLENWLKNNVEEA